MQLYEEPEGGCVVQTTPQLSHEQNRCRTEGETLQGEANAEPQPGTRWGVAPAVVATKPVPWRPRKRKRQSQVDKKRRLHYWTENSRYDVAPACLACGVPLHSVDRL